MPARKTAAAPAPTQPPATPALSPAAPVKKAAPAPRVAKGVKAVQATKATKPAKAKEAARGPKSTQAAKVESPAPAAVAKPGKPRDKLVRDSFTMPQSDFALIDLLKERALGFKRPTKKSELLRAGLQALAALSPTALKTALGQLVPLKTGRPKKGA